MPGTAGGTRLGLPSLPATAIGAPRERKAEVTRPGEIPGSGNVPTRKYSDYLGCLAHELIGDQIAKPSQAGVTLAVNMAPFLAKRFLKASNVLLCGGGRNLRP